MTDDIGYEALTQAAMRGVVREALRMAQPAGHAPGDHHFYVTFRTRAPGVQIASYLIERFPEDMTIVIQHQFWDLEVHENHFEIVLKFSGVPQHLYIPYTAITQFVDPSVGFGLSFEAKGGTMTQSLVSPVEATESAPPEQEAPRDAADAGTVVNLDAFRRK